jgi:tRNA threonylcarbamoyladenosine biosynthesis protein TsaE
MARIITPLTKITYSEAETIALGHQLGLELPANSIICLFGDLGAGKTTFVKGIASAFSDNIDSEIATSPTFVHLNIYPGKKTVYHFDLYRLKSANSFFDMGFDEVLYSGGISCIEWSERIEAFLPSHCIKVHMSHRSDNEREINIKVAHD